MEIKDAQKRVFQFTNDRAWNIITASHRGNHLVREVGKLMEYILFNEGVTTKPTEINKLPKQLGDVLFSLMALANSLDIDLDEQLNEAMKQDSIKYPAKETKLAALQAYSTRTEKSFAKSAKLMKKASISE